MDAICRLPIESLLLRNVSNYCSFTRRVCLKGRINSHKVSDNLAVAWAACAGFASPGAAKHINVLCI